jgi:prepilin-type N-terminal cleavage/methylation domain-containing protein
MSIKQCKGHAKQTGFTLVELAIVLVIIGLILGMAFKGKDLIDGAKVKSLAAQYNKIQAAFNIYFEKYGAYPGDGCTAL